MKNSIILASASPRRKQLLGMLYPNLSIIPSSVDEPLPNGEAPADYAMHLAKMKAANVAERNQNSLVIGSDTIVLLDDIILGKPLSKEEAFDILRKLSGRRHTVISAVCLIHRGSDSKTFFESTGVTFAELSDDEINRYIATGSPMDKAGAYGIQDDLGALFVQKIEGDYYNVVGFPLHRFYTELKSFAPDYLPSGFQKP
ncbi:MAG: Maf family protein [Balneolia bacterium]|nr:Maf family protein [Balneolia bacterium]